MKYTWQPKAIEAVKNAIDLFADGGLTFVVGEKQPAVAVAPMPLDSDADGGPAFVSFALDIGALAEVFDKTPAICWCTFPTTLLSLEGRIDGYDAKIYVCEKPFENKLASAQEHDGDMEKTTDVDDYGQGQKGELEGVLRKLVEIAYGVDVTPAYLHAFRKTGLIVTASNEHQLSDGDRQRWQAALAEGEAIHSTGAFWHTASPKGEPN